MKYSMMAVVTAFLLSVFILCGCVYQPSKSGEAAKELSTQDVEAVQDVAVKDAEEVKDPSAEAVEEVKDPLVEDVEEVKEPSDDTSAEDGTADIDEYTEDAAEAYASFIDMNRKEQNELYGFGFDMCRYAMIHLDDDEIPELALISGDCHANSVIIFSYDGNEVKEVAANGSNGLAYYEKGSGVIFGWHTGMGETWHGITILKDGKAVDEIDVIIAMTGDDIDLENGPFEYSYKIPTKLEDYHWDYEEITREKFDEILDPYLPQNRDYSVISYDLLSMDNETTDIKQTLIDSLEKEDDYPKADLEKYKEGVLPM